MKYNKELILLALKQWGYQWKQNFKELKRYGKYRRFLFPWLWLKLSYLFDSPYTVSRRYHRSIQSEDIHVYGETPLNQFRIDY